MDADSGKAERKSTVMNVCTVFLLALEYIRRESEFTVYSQWYFLQQRSYIVFTKSRLI
jgi:hypothetical protein